MAISTYSQLKTAVADWLNRDDMVSVIPSFISLAEAGIERVLRTRSMVNVSEISIDDEYVDLPADFLEARSLKLLGQFNSKRVEFVTLDTLDNLDEGVGQTQYFSVAGNKLKFWPQGSTAYDAEFTYYTVLPKLSDTNTSNWLLTSSPDVYLYGTLMQAAPYLKDDERLAVWSQLYVSAIQQLQAADERGATSGGILKSRVRSFGAR
jgi:hypothetical protein